MAEDSDDDWHTTPELDSLGGRGRHQRKNSKYRDGLEKPSIMLLESSGTRSRLKKVKSRATTKGFWKKGASECGKQMLSISSPAKLER